MPDKLILITHDDPALREQVQSLSGGLRIVSKDEIQREPSLLEQVEIAYGHLDHDQLRRASRLRWLQVVSAGLDEAFLSVVRGLELTVTNTSGIHAEPTTEQMFGMLLMTTRCLNQAWDQQKTRQWRGFDFGAHVTMLSGRTLGVLGVGAIGGHAARVGKALGMKVIGLRRGGQPHPDVETMYTPETRLEFFARCDVVMNVLPLTENTRHFMGEAEFAALPPGAIVVNTGRGGTIDTDALLKALNEGRLGAALLDVTDPEPLPEEHPLWTAPRVFITPHYSGAHPQYMERSNAIFVDNLRRYLAGEPLRNVVDKGEGY